MHRVPSIHITSSLSLPLPRMSVSHPIHTLPAELLSHIFVLCLPRTQNATGLRHVSRHRAPLLLTRVCGLWRAVALGTPELWSELFIQPSPHVEMLEFWLGHGAEHPLSLYLHYRQPMAGMGMGMLSLLTASAGRWRDVDLFLHPSTLEHARIRIWKWTRATPPPATPASSSPITWPHPSRGCKPKANHTIQQRAAAHRGHPHQDSPRPRTCRSALGAADGVVGAVWLGRCADQKGASSGAGAEAVEDADRASFRRCGDLPRRHRSRCRTPRPRVAVDPRPPRCTRDRPNPHAAFGPRVTLFEDHGPTDVYRYGRPWRRGFAKRGDSKKLERLTLTGPPATLCRVLEAFGGGLRVLELRDVAHGALCALLEGLALAGGFDLLPDLESLHIDAFHSAHGIPYALLLDALQVRAGRLASFTMSVTSVSKAEGKEEEEYLPELARLKDQGMTIRMEYMCGGSVV
ncbi:hypothetical protein C8F01DRAFT_1177635 [Mycena amicta]|nr:hypothetical protein C8F01DRAFT_1177635 [Mycena amicta]